MNSRHQQIVHWVNERGHVSVSELSQLTGVSEVTVRQDLNALEKADYLKRVHGSAVALESDNVGARMRTRYPLKKRLAEHAATLIADGEAVFIEGGSTNALLARTLAEQRRSVTIITVSHYIANLLKETDIDVVMLGGLYQKSSESVVGPLTRFCIQQTHFQKAFIGVDGWHPQTGFTGRDMLRCDVVNAVMAKQVETIALTDASKFGQVLPYTLTGPDYVLSRVITDDTLAVEYQTALRAARIAVDLINSDETKETSSVASA